MATTLNLYETLLRLLEYAEMDANFKNLRTTADAALPAATAAATYSPLTGPGAGQVFTVGVLTSGQLIATQAAGYQPILARRDAAGTLDVGVIALQAQLKNSLSNYFTTCALTGLGESNTAGAENAGLLLSTIRAGVLTTSTTFLSTGTVLIGTSTNNGSGAKLQVAGVVSAATHNTSDLGTTAVRWKDLWLQSGAFNGSDARLKTAVQQMTAAEINAASQLSKEIGTYQWLQSVAEKGADNARRHTGLTVQRAIDIMTENGLDWSRYAFIGYDKWDDKINEHPAVEAIAAQAAQPAEYETQIQTETVIIDGVTTELQRPVLVCTKEAVSPVEAAPAIPARTEVSLKAGDAYSFRYDQLNMFIARGFEARLAALEGK